MDLLLSLRPDIVVLTEFRMGKSGDLILGNLAKAGFCELLSAARVQRENSVCVLSTMPLHRIDLSPPIGEEHRLLACDFGEFRLVAAYFPLNQRKKRVFDFVQSTCLTVLGPRGILIGDLNTGMHYLDEMGATFACTQEFDDLLGAGLVDSWRSRNSQAREYSWFSSRGNGFRIDHVLCTPEMDTCIDSIAYEHRSREQSVSDHSTLVVDISPSW